MLDWVFGFCVVVLAFWDSADFTLAIADVSSMVTNFRARQELCKTIMHLFQFFWVPAHYVKSSCLPASIMIEAQLLYQNKGPASILNPNLRLDNCLTLPPTILYRQFLY
jgi:hypothetical protein